MSSGRIVISSRNEGPVVNAINWSFTIVVAFTVAMKVFDKWQRTHGLAADDYLLGAAFVLVIGQTVAVAEEVKAGLGKPWSSLDDDKQMKFEKASYAAQFLYAMILCLTKCATMLFLRAVAPVPWMKRNVNGYIALIVAWTCASLITIAFQCDLPHPWITGPGRCISEEAFWVAFGVIDVLTDGWLVVIPAVLFRKLQSSGDTKRRVFLSFAARLLTVPIIVCRLVYLIPSLQSYNASTKLFAAIIATDVHIRLSIVLACVPFITVVLGAMQHGFITGEVYERGSRAARGHDVDYSGTRAWSSWARFRKLSRSKPQRSISLQRLQGGEVHDQELGTRANASGDGRFEPLSNNQRDGQIEMQTTITTDLERR